MGLSGVIDTTGLGLKFLSKAITFDGTAGNGAIGNVVYFTITGAVHVVSWDAVVEVTVGVDGGTGVASCSLGTTGTTTLFVAATTATLLTTTNKLWYSATPNANGIALPATYKDIAVQQNLVLAVTSSGTQKVNAGRIRLTVSYLPTTADGQLV